MGKQESWPTNEAGNSHKNFLTNKNPYREIGIADCDRIAIIDRYCEVVSGLPVQIVNIVINKPIIRMGTYPVLDNALTYSIQRVDNTIQEPNEKFIIITDDGRIPKMRKTTRRIQVFNLIPSRYEGFEPAHHPIDRLIEDPLPKASQHSYYVQTSDLVAFLVYNYMLVTLTKSKLYNRLPAGVNYAKITQWLDLIKPVLNLKASRYNKYGYGIVCYPTS